MAVGFRPFGEKHLDGVLYVRPDRGRQCEFITDVHSEIILLFTGVTRFIDMFLLKSKIGGGIRQRHRCQRHQSHNDSLFHYFIGYYFHKWLLQKRKGGLSFGQPS